MHIIVCQTRGTHYNEQMISLAVNTQCLVSLREYYRYRSSINMLKNIVITF
jgi:hypothetical protein